MSAAGSSAFLAQLRTLDLHPKLVKDFAVRTKSGAAVSIAAVIIATLLFFSELSEYRSVDRIEHMEVDPVSRGSRMRINFEVVFPDMPCALVSLDAMDASGNQQLDLLHDIFKRRVDQQGNLISVEAVTNATKGTLRTAAELEAEKQRAIADGRVATPVTGCGDCYGAADAGVCCNTCEDVRAAYRKKGWGFNMDTVEQCKKEGFYGDVSAQLLGREGCDVFGHVEVPKVAGNVHFAPGHGMQHAYAHVHDLLSFTLQSFNISHTVRSLSFGAYVPGVRNPLDGVSRTLDSGSGMQQYFVKLVPTVYVPLAGPQVHSYQFSVTEHLKRIDPRTIAADNAAGLLPGVFFNYELSPLRVRIEERGRSFVHFLTRVCAIIGGVFTVMGVVDALLHRALEGLSRKQRSVMAMSGGLIS